MSDLSPLYVAGLGVLFGLGLFLPVNRWFLAIMIARRDGTPHFPVAFVHSGLWALCGTLAFTGYILLKPHEAWWHWFFGAFYVVPVCIYSYATCVVVWRRARRAKNHAA